MSDEILEGMEGEGGTTVDKPSPVFRAGMTTKEIYHFLFLPIHGSRMWNPWLCLYLAHRTMFEKCATGRFLLCCYVKICQLTV